MLNFGPQILGPHGTLGLHLNKFETSSPTLLMFQTNHECLANAGSSEEDFERFSPHKPILNIRMCPWDTDALAPNIEV